MGLLGEVKAQGAKVNICRVAAIRNELNKADQDEFDQVVMDQSIPMRWIVKALLARGLHLSDKPLGRHRARECNCFRGQ